jgi:hypothetical protein
VTQEKGKKLLSHPYHSPTGEGGREGCGSYAASSRKR